MRCLDPAFAEWLYANASIFSWKASEGGRGVDRTLKICNPLCEYLRDVNIYTSSDNEKRERGNFSNAFFLKLQDDESSDEDERGNDVPLSIGQKTPATGKLTRTQRNKLARKKQAMYEQAAKRRKKALNKSIDE